MAHRRRQQQHDACVVGADHSAGPDVMTQRLDERRQQIARRLGDGRNRSTSSLRESDRSSLRQRRGHRRRDAAGVPEAARCGACGADVCDVCVRGPRTRLSRLARVPRPDSPPRRPLPVCVAKVQPQLIRMLEVPLAPLLERPTQQFADRQLLLGNLFVLLGELIAQ